MVVLLPQLIVQPIAQMDQILLITLVFVPIVITVQILSSVPDWVGTFIELVGVPVEIFTEVGRG
jgi:hypothetical protein